MTAAIPDSGAWLLDCTMEEYFADPLPTPSLSQSIAKTLVTKSPLHAWQEHPRLGDTHGKHTRATDRGSVLGSLILKTSNDVIERVHGFDNFKKADAIALRDAARERGRVPVLDREFDELSFAAVKIERNFAELGIFFDGESERKIAWWEQTEEGPVLCRGMLDHLKRARQTAWDLKSITSAHPDKVTKQIEDFGYAIQHAAYTSALRWFGMPSPSLGFLFFETEPPFAVLPVRPSASLIELGERQWTRGVRAWGRCVREGVWPGYVDRENAWATIGARPWALAREGLADVA